MKLFSFFKKQKETIDIKMPDGPVNKSSQIAKDEEIYYERVEYQADKFSLKDCVSEEEQKNKLINTNDNIEKKFGFLFHTYNFLKLFSRSADKDNKFNEKMIVLDKQINRMKKMHDDIKRRIELIKYIEASDHELESVSIAINDLITFYNNIELELADLKARYYKHLKMASFSICNDKSYQELDALNKNIKKIIDGYKNLSEAYDYIYYNSGDLIVDTVNALMDCFENSNNKELRNSYKFNYFLNSDYVVALSFAEWIELFTKIKYVMRVASKVELFDYLKFRDLYTELEKRYILMLIYNEMKR
ncbi:MAG: hypothetical protein WC006_05525 [Bacilli bacterium]